VEAVREAPPGSTLVALPYVSKDGFSGPTVRSLLNGFASGKFGNVLFVVIGDKTQVAARNEACRKALDHGAEYLFFVDSDQDFPPDAISRLKAADADVACADMWSRSWPSFRIVFQPDPVDGKYYPVSDTVADRGGVEDIGYCGMGCTLIRTSILREMKEKFPDQPWFWTADHGEDATLCFKVREIGGSVKCDFSLKSGHWSYCRMMGQDFTRRPIE
jgi:cellulose synthase/poly-beta-1,6-N-acetylglucosamine synthase-like glycosyltransferase